MPDAQRLLASLRNEDSPLVIERLTRCVEIWPLLRSSLTFIVPVLRPWFPPLAVLLNVVKIQLAALVCEAGDSQTSTVLYTLPLAVNHKPSQSAVLLRPLRRLPTPSQILSFHPCPTERLHSLHTVYVEHPLLIVAHRRPVQRKRRAQEPPSLLMDDERFKVCFRKPDIRLVLPGGTGTVQFTLTVKLKEGLTFLGARPSNPTQWIVSQDVRSEGHRVVTLHCRRKESGYDQQRWISPVSHHFINPPHHTDIRQSTHYSHSTRKQVALCQAGKDLQALTCNQVELHPQRLNAAGPGDMDFCEEDRRRQCRSTCGCKGRAGRSEMGVQRVLQVDLKMEIFPEPLGSRWMAWQVEYPASRAATQEAETEIQLAQEDLAGIVPLAMVRRATSNAGPTACP
ncbi:hypothetical protein EYF80_003331 [Liparis tanakae]|uniref:Transmembrane protein TMEM132 cohesin-like domain-containing protein n=1 Tax=Liparis tanakae TaxID=230148 RepID=A0A4Z2J9G8_9TELE|nr:hypothetical protein EYF80_003331 [Liparis tanakae]